MLQSISYLSIPYSRRHMPCSVRLRDHLHIRMPTLISPERILQAGDRNPTYADTSLACAVIDYKAVVMSNMSF